MNRKFFPLTLSLLASLGLVFTGFLADAKAQGPKQLRLCHNSNLDSATDKASHKFAEMVEKKTNGQVKIAVYPRNQLGGNRELLEQVKMGSLDLTLMGLGTLGYMVEEYNFMQIPFAFRNQEHIHKVLDSEVGKTIEKTVAAKGFFLLNQKWDRLPRHIAGKKAVLKMEDLKNLKVREGTPAFHEGIKLYGASPVKHTYGTQFVAMSKKSFDALPPDVQKALLEAAGEGADFNNRLTWSQEEDYLKKIEKAGVKINKPDYSPFPKTLEANIAVLEKKWPACKGLFAKIQSIK
ncbi:MAG: C4-dicarboxylate transporter [Deltaproteobacteria bacterium]|nr:C4-dicarboxylate transporter [Deltaproteobacteria bacterium]